MLMKYMYGRDRAHYGICSVSVWTSLPVVVVVALVPRSLVIVQQTVERPLRVESRKVLLNRFQDLTCTCGC